MCKQSTCYDVYVYMNTVTMYTGINDTLIQRILSIVVLVLYQAKFNCLDLLILNLP